VSSIWFRIVTQDARWPKLFSRGKATYSFGDRELQGFYVKILWITLYVYRGDVVF
jgi:hypothetical protein